MNDPCQGNPASQRPPFPGRVYLESVGCQMNRLDEQVLAGALADLGFQRVHAPDEGDIILLFTCSVRSKPEEKVFSRLGQLKKLKQKNPSLRLGVLGCMAERLGREVVERAPFVDVVAGSGSFLEVPALLASEDTAYPVILTGFDKPVVFTRRPAFRRSPFQAFVSIMRGCRKYCTYCVVPYVRGPERSRPLVDVVDEVTRLAEDGVVEVTLLGQSISMFGKDTGESLTSLLSAVCRINGIERVRFLTSHPADFDTAVLGLYRETDRLCPHIQMPAQSGSDLVLKRMNRGYTADQYRSLVTRAREEVPGMEITSDFIVGFPGETEADFQATLDLVSWAGFRNIFAFKYVPRPGTRAWKTEDDVSQELKQERLQRLLALQREVGEQRNRALIGSALSILVEGPSSRDPSRCTGRSAANHIATFKGSGTPGSFLDLRIVDATSLTVHGERILP